MAEQRQTRREMSGDSPTKIDADKYDQIRASGRHITALDVSQIQDEAMGAVNPQLGSQSGENEGEERREQEGDSPNNTTTDPATQQQPLTLATTAPTGMQPAPPAPPAAQVAQPAAGAAGALPLPVPDAKGYFGKDQVVAHEHTHDFYHRGRGQWLAGLPPPGSDPRTGVRGPGAAGWKAANVGQ